MLHAIFLQESLACLLLFGVLRRQIGNVLLALCTLPFGFESMFQDDREYLLATTEKAICDKLYKMPPTKNYKDLEALMFEDLRFDEDIVENLDRKTISEYAGLYRSTTIHTLDRWLGV